MSIPITSPIIFALGSAGVGKFRADMMIAAGAVGIVFAALRSGQKAAEDFAVKMNALDTESRKMSLAMDAAAKGMIKTEETFVINTKMKQANVEVTKELSDAMGRLIGDAAAKFNWNIETATQKAHALAEGIAKGSTRALREYGIDLKESGTLHEKQADAMQKVIERAEGVHFELKTGRMQWDALKNNVGTAQGYMYDLATNGIPGVSTALTKMNELLGTATAAYEKMKSTVENTNWTVWQTGAMGFLQAIGAVPEGTLALIGQKLREQQAANAPPSAEDPFSPTLSPTDPALFTAPAARRGGGGRATAAPSPERPETTMANVAAGQLLEEMSIMLPAIAQGWQDSAAAEAHFFDIALEGVAVQRELNDALMESGDPELVAVALAKVGAQQEYNEELQEQLRLDAEAYRMDAEAWAAVPLEAKQELWQAELEHEEAMRQMEMERAAFRGELAVEEMTRRVTDVETALGIEQHHLDASAAMWSSGLQNKLSMSASMLRGWSSLMMSENKKAFQVGKAAAITMTIIDGLAASIAAFRSLAGIPYVGPILGAIAAAGAIAQMVITVQKIKATKFGAAGAPSGGAGVSTGGGSGGASAASGVGAGGGAMSVHVNVTVPLDGEDIYNNQQTHNARAQREGRPAFQAAA